MIGCDSTVAAAIWETEQQTGRHKKDGQGEDKDKKDKVDKDKLEKDKLEMDKADKQKKQKEKDREKDNTWISVAKKKPDKDRKNEKDVEIPKLCDEDLTDRPFVLEGLGAHMIAADVATAPRRGVLLLRASDEVELAEEMMLGAQAPHGHAFAVMQPDPRGRHVPTMSKGRPALVKVEGPRHRNRTSDRADPAQRGRQEEVDQARREPDHGSPRIVRQQMDLGRRRRGRRHGCAEERQCGAQQVDSAFLLPQQGPRQRRQPGLRR